jgi:hypothetical protein
MSVNTLIEAAQDGKKSSKPWNEQLSIDPETRWRRFFEFFMVILSVYSSFMAAYV